MGDKLFAKLDIGFSDHAKIIGLSDSAFRAFIEALLYSRQQLTDGFLDERVVLRKWGQAVIDELTSNDPSNPSWVRVDGGFKIHDYETNQMTNADIEAKRAAGRRGGLAKAQRNSSKVLAPATKVPEQTSSKTLLDKRREDIEIDNKRATRINDSWNLNNVLIAWTKTEAPNMNIEREREKFIDYWLSKSGSAATKTDWERTWKNWVRSNVERNPSLAVRAVDPNEWMIAQRIEVS
jgi:hypothetical protein